MLQSTPLSKVYGHGHIKKFWLMQNQKETENKALLASSTSRNTGNSSGLGHESKQGTQFSVGSTSTRMLTSPAGLPVRPLVSGPACFNMARQTSLVTCAESLSPPGRMEQSRSLVRPPSPSISKEENCCLATETDCMVLHTPCQEDANSASTSQWGVSFGYGDQLTGDFSSPIMPTVGGFSDTHELSPSIKEFRQNNEPLQEGFQHGKSSDDASNKADNSEPSKGGLGFFSKLETATPFSVPFQLPKNYFLDAGAKLFDAEAGSEVGVTLVNSHPDKSALPSILNCGHGRRALFGTVEAGASKEDGFCSTVLRTCSVCGTSKTPLWRSGPQGPKSLCNACGIRFKKAKRGSSEGVGCPTTTSLANPSAKTSVKPVKRKQDTPSVNADTKPLAMNGLATQAVKKRRWSQLIRNEECATQNCDVTGSSNESSLTWNLHSPSAVSSPCVSHFERLSITENFTAPDLVAGKDEEEAAVLLMYMSWGLVFA